MIAQVVSRKYAQALFLSTREKGLIDLAYEQFNDLNKLLAADASLMNFLKAPQVLEENKISLVRDVFKERLDNLFIEFVVVLIEKGRIGHLPGIIKEFNQNFFFGRICGCSFCSDSRFVWALVLGSNLDFAPFLIASIFVSLLRG